MHRSFVRPTALAVTLVGCAAACNLILDNQVPDFVAADGAAAADATSPVADGSTSSPEAGGYPTEQGCGASAGNWTTCAGGGTCAAASATILTDDRFTQLHRTASGLIAFGSATKFLVPDGTGGPGESPSRALPFLTAETITADREYVYELSVALGVELRRYRLDSLALDDTWVPDQLQGLGNLEAGELPVLVALGEGTLLGFSHRFTRDEVSAIHFLTRWRESVKPSAPAIGVNGFASVGFVDGAYGMAQLAKPPAGRAPTLVQAFRVDDPSAAPALSGSNAAWKKVLESPTDDAGNGAPFFYNAYFGLACQSTYVMSTRYAKAPLLARLVGADQFVTDLTAAMGGVAQAIDRRYHGGVARWTLATDRNALYVARSGESLDATVPATAGEIFVFDYGMNLLAHVETPGMARQLAVTGCYLYWLEQDGLLRRMAKPGSSCAVKT